jgi:hypothetical protein
VRESLLKFKAVGYSIPQSKGTINRLTVSERDLTALSRDLDGYYPWIGDDVVSVIHILRASAKLEEPVGAIADRLQRFDPVGVELPSLEISKVGDLQVMEEDLVVLSQNHDGAAPWVGDRISIGHVLAAAHARGEAVGKIVAQLQRFEPVGFALPDIGANVRSMRVSEQDLVLLSEDLDARSPWLSGSMPAIHLLKAANRLEEPVGDTLQRLQKLEQVKAVTYSSVLTEPSRAWRRRVQRGY